jgi:3-oxoadipate enol-lactonase
MQDRFSATKFGRIHTLSAGGGAPLLLLHSNGGSAYEYEHVIDDLARRYRVIAWDMPGQGDSDPLNRHHSVEDYAEAVVVLMDALEIPKATVLGASIGGAICVALGARHASRIDRLFIVECPFRSPEEWLKNWPNTEANYAPATQTMEKITPRFRTVSPELLQRWNIDRAKAGAKTCLSVMWALREYDIGRDVPSVPPGQVLVFGDKGPTIGKRAQFEAVLRQPRTHVIANCGHFPMIDDPERFIAIVDEEMSGPANKK